jgi:DNA-directed RNA polymerase specialized sigma24 family protein
VLAFLARRTFDTEAARDLMAETFAQAYRSRTRFRGSSDAEAAAWLYSIALVLAASRRRVTSVWQDSWGPQWCAAPTVRLRSSISILG